jgi:ABC-2 type transport system permease protein/oleandomycin transport system permease protein
MNKFLIDTWALAQRSTRRALRTPQVIVFTLVQPIMFVLLFRYVFGGAIQVPDGFSYVNLLIPGIVVQNAVFSAAGASVGIAEDARTGFTDRLRVLPTSRLAPLTGRVLSDTGRAGMLIIIIALVGLAVGFRPEFGWGLLAAFVLLILIAFGFAWIATAIGISAKTPEAAQSAGFIWIFPLTFASSVFVPVETMPGWLQPIARANPVTQFADAVRSMVLGGGITSALWWSLAWVVALTVVGAALSIRAWNRMSRA